MIPALLSAQGEMLVLRKKGKVEKTFFKGSNIIFNAGFGMMQGNIYGFRNDSVFIISYDVRPVMTSLGITVYDTVSTYLNSFYYKDIIKIGREEKGWSWSASGASLFGGGTLLTLGGLATWIFAKKDTRYYARPGFVAVSAAAAGVGYLLMTGKGKKIIIGNKYTLEYIDPN